MKFTSIMAIVAMLSLVAPVMAELSDYQRGVQDGLSAGTRMGYLLGAAPYDMNAAQQYTSLLNAFNAQLQSIFGTNQTAINLFWMSPLSSQITTTGYQAYPTVNGTKPTHAIDGSWNQSTIAYHPDAKNKIYGYDPDSYYTMVGWDNAPASAAVPKNSGYGDNLGGV